MRPSHLSASTAALLISSSALLAQEAPASFENVFVDVGGTAIRVPADLAAEACRLDEAAVQRATIANLEASGLDAEVVQGLFAAEATTLRDDGVSAMGGTDATADIAGSGAAAGVTPTGEYVSGQAAMDATSGLTPTGSYATDDDTSPMGASETSIGGLQAGTEQAANTPAPGGEPAPGGAPVTVEDPARATEMATADAGADMSRVLESAEVTAAPEGAAATNEQMLALSVCQVNLVRAGEVGIDGTDVGN